MEVMSFFLYYNKILCIYYNMGLMLLSPGIYQSFSTHSLVLSSFHQRCKDGLFEYQKVKFVNVLLFIPFQKTNIGFVSIFCMWVQKNSKTKQCVYRSFSSIFQGLHVHKRLWWALILYKTYKRTHVAFFFSLVFGFFPLTLSVHLSIICHRMTNDHSVCHEIWLSGRSLGNGTCSKDRPGRHRKLQLDIVSMFLDLVQLKITTPVMSKRSN